MRICTTSVRTERYSRCSSVFSNAGLSNINRLLTLFWNHLFRFSIAIRLPRFNRLQQSRIRQLSGGGVEISTPGWPSRLRADSEVPVGNRFAPRRMAYKLLHYGSGQHKMMKEHFAMSVCRQAPIL